MTLFPTYFGFLLVLLITCLAGCGGGTVEIKERSYDNLRVSPNTLLNRLEKAKTDEERTMLLEGLQSQDAYRFDWPVFWEQLAIRPLGATLHQSHRAQLESLASSRCEVFTEFTRFVLSVKGSIEVVTSNSRLCPTSLTPDVAMQVATRMASGSSAAEVLESFSFLTKEASVPGREDQWMRELEKAEPLLQTYATKLMISAEHRSAYLDGIGLMRRERRRFYPRDFLPRLLADEARLNEWFARFPGKPAFDSLVELVAEIPVFSPTEQSIGHLVSAMNKALLASGANSVAELGPKALKLMLTALRHAPLRLQATSVDPILQQVEMLLLELEDGTRAQVLGQWLSQENLEIDYGLIQWLALRMDGPSREFEVLVRQSLQNPNPSVVNQSSLGLDRMIRSLLRAFIEPGPAKKLVFETICKQWESTNVPLVQISDGDKLQLLLENRLAPGCYALTGGQDMEIHSELPLGMAFGSVLLGSDQSISLQAPRVSLGSVYLSRSTVMPQLATTPTPPSANALAFPLLLAVVVKERTEFFAPATHFFVYHYTFREALAGEAEPEFPAPGDDGRDLTLATAEVPLAFPFYSEGGQGQIGAHPRPGGQGDTSFVSFEKLGTWVRALIDEEKLDIPDQGKMNDRLTLESADDLLNHAERSAEGEIKVRTVPGYLERLAPLQRQKVILACREILGMSEVSRAQLEDCFYKRFPQAAMHNLELTITRSHKDGSLSRNGDFPALNPERDFDLPPGKKGPINPNGPDGKPGELILKRITP